MQDQIESALTEIRFGPDGLVPAIAQQYDSGEILMLAWMNADAVRVSLEEGRACYWSRSRAKLSVPAMKTARMGVAELRS